MWREHGREKWKEWRTQWKRKMFRREGRKDQNVGWREKWRELRTQRKRKAQRGAGRVE